MAAKKAAGIFTVMVKEKPNGIWEHTVWVDKAAPSGGSFGSLRDATAGLKKARKDYPQNEYKLVKLSTSRP